MKARVTICYRDCYRSNDCCTKYRDAIILLLSAALQYFRFGIRVVRVTEQSIHSYGKRLHDVTGNTRAFLSLSVNLIRFVWSQSVVHDRPIARRKDIGEADAEKYGCPRIFQWFPLGRVAIWLPHRFVKLVGACKIQATLLRLTFIELSVPFHRQTSGISVVRIIKGRVFGDFWLIDV